MLGRLGKPLERCWLGRTTSALTSKKGENSLGRGNSCCKDILSWKNMAALTGLQTWLWLGWIDGEVIALSWGCDKLCYVCSSLSKSWNGIRVIESGHFDLTQQTGRNDKFKCSLLGKSIWYIGNQPYVLKGMYWCSLVVWHTTHLLQMFLGTLPTCKNVMLV